jgi:hypothetical protein
MTCIPELILNYRYSQEIKNYCAIYPDNPVCIKYNQNNDSTSWLSTMSYENQIYYIGQLHSKSGVNGVTAEKLVVDFSLLNCLSMLVLFLANLITIFNVSTIVLEIDFLLTTPSDFTHMVSNLPKDLTKTELKQILGSVKIKIILGF